MGSITQKVSRIIGIIVFAGLTQSILILFSHLANRHTQQIPIETEVVVGALSLYLDFLNLFLFIFNLAARWGIELTVNITYG